MTVVSATDFGVVLMCLMRGQSKLSGLDAKVQQDHNSGACKILRLSSRRGSIRHMARPDLLIVRRGFLMEPAEVVWPACKVASRQFHVVLDQFSISGTTW